MRFILRCVKIFLRVCAFLLLLVSAIVVASAILIHLLVTPESLKVFFVDQLQDALHRPVQIESVRFLITQGIQFRGVKVLEAPGFPDREFISSEMLLAKYNWRALLDRRIEINEVQLESPKIRLVHRADGVWNIRDMFVSTASAHTAVPPGPIRLPVAFAADRIVIDDGVMTVRDLAHSRDYLIRGFNLKVKGFNETSPFAFDVSFENADRFRGAVLHTKVSADGRMAAAGFHWNDASLWVDRLRASVEGKPLSGTATLRDFQHPAIDFRLNAPAIDSDFLAHFSTSAPRGIDIPAGQWRGSVSFPSIGEFRVGNLEVKAPPVAMHLTGAMKYEPEATQYSSKVDFSSFPLEKVSTMWRNASKYALKGEISGSAAIQGDLQSTDHRLEIANASLQIRRVSGKFFKSCQVNQVDASILGSDNMQKLSVAVSGGEASLYGTAISDLDALFAVKKGNLEIERFNFTWTDSHVKVKGRVTGMDPPTDVSLNGVVDKVKLEQLIDTIDSLRAQIQPPNTRRRRAGPWARVFKYSFPKTFPSISGTLKVGEVVYPNFQSYNLDGSWNLRGISTGLKKVSGNIQVGFGPGRVFDIPALEKDNSILRVVFLPFVFMHKLNNLTVISLNTAYPKTLDYNRIFGEYSLNQGVVDVRVFHVDSAPLVAYADGTVDFPREKINLHVLTRLNQARGSLPEYLTDQRGRPSIGFFVEDNLNTPQIRIDYHKMEEDAIEKALQAGMRRTHVSPGDN